MADKFGWQKAARKDIAKKASGPTNKQRRRRKKKTRAQPKVITRLCCPQCLGLTIVTVIRDDNTGFFRCTSCDQRVTNPTAILMRKNGAYLIPLPGEKPPYSSLLSNRPESGRPHHPDTVGEIG